MRSDQIYNSKILLLSPIVGMLGFIFIYILATMQYPGGSYENIQQPGFSWLHNYLCDMLDANAVNGQKNSASITSRIGLGFLCFGISILWYLIPLLFPKNKTTYLLIRISGIGSMITILFLAFGAHDQVVRIAGILGLIAMLTTFIALYKLHSLWLLFYGCMALILIAINFYIYESGNGIHWLPLLQKITFLYCFGWFFMLNLKLYKNLIKQ